MALGFSPRSGLLVSVLGVEGDVFFGERVVDRVVKVDTDIVNLLREVGFLLAVEVFLFFTALEAVQFLSRRLAVYLRRESAFDRTLS